MNNLTILLVDDDPASLVLLEERLRAADYNDIETAKNGVEALKLISKRFFDVVLTDLMMPGVDGIGVLKGTKERYSNSEVILITAHASVDNAVDAMKKGATDYLKKPINFDELVIRLEKISNLKALAKNASDLREAMDVTESNASETIQNLEIMVAQLEDKFSRIKIVLSRQDVDAVQRIADVLELCRSKYL